MTQIVDRPFDILDPKETIYQSTLLEASAGTGKTFAIENLVVRLLLEDDPLPIENVLAVTFTKAAARDLKERIRSNIENSLLGLNRRLKGEEVTLLPYLDQYRTHEQIKLARRSLEHALFCFDKAQIFTIHGFCRRMLTEYLFEGNFFPHSEQIEDLVSNQKVIKAIRDYFRTEVRSPQYSPGEIDQILSYHQGSLEKVEKELMRLLLQGIEFAKVPSFQERFSAFRERFQNISLKKEDLIAWSHEYKGILNRSKEVKPEYLLLFERIHHLFSKKNLGHADFDTLLRDFPKIEALFSKDKIKKGAVGLSDENAIYKMKGIFHPLIPFCRLARGIRRVIKDRMELDEFFSCDELLIAMNKALNYLPFKQLVQKRYRAAIIDEFQDTDPIQWSLFEHLFVNDHSLLYLVGDPKQSIYAFRQADIYTYREASKKISRKATLATNFRSQSTLVQGLNALFSEACDLFPLPREKECMDFYPVEPSNRISSVDYSDGRGSVHFWVAEESKSIHDFELDLFFPLIINEIKIGGPPFSKYAVLVADRWQQERVINYFNMWKVPCFSQRVQNLTQTIAYQSLIDILTAIQEYSDFSAIKRACGSPLIGLTLDEMEWNEKILFRFRNFRQILHSQGFASLYFQLLQTRWKSEETALERLLKEKRGIEFYKELQQLAECLFQANLTPDGMIKFLIDLKLMDFDEKLKKRADVEKDAVNVLTIHKAKGLEFDVVFALGLIKQTPEQKSLIPVYNQGVRELTPLFKKDDLKWIHHLNEQDAEKMRQLYVALTRAKYRLFCPAILKGDKVPSGKISPMELFLSKCPLEEVSKKCSHVTFEKIQKKNVAEKPLDISDSVELTPPQDVLVLSQSKMITSFSALASKDKEIKSIQAPSDFKEVNKTPHTLPAGSETGLMFHTLLETFDFKNASRESLCCHVKKSLKKTKFFTWEEVINDVLWDAITLDLGGFSLCNVDPKKIMRETTFLYPSEKNYLKGVIDLVFEFENKYYLIDWKSNWLGPNDKFYSIDSLQLAMQEHQYFLQLETYREALNRWLCLHIKLPFDAVFGNCFYLFLRGGKKGLWKEK